MTVSSWAGCSACFCSRSIITLTSSPVSVRRDSPGSASGGELHVGDHPVHQHLGHQVERHHEHDAVEGLEQAGSPAAGTRGASPCPERPTWKVSWNPERPSSPWDTSTALQRLHHGQRGPAPRPSGPSSWSGAHPARLTSGCGIGIAERSAPVSSSSSNGLRALFASQMRQNSSGSPMVRVASRSRRSFWAGITSLKVSGSEARGHEAAALVGAQPAIRQSSNVAVSRL